MEGIEPSLLVYQTSTLTVVLHGAVNNAQGGGRTRNVSFKRGALFRLSYPRELNKGGKI